MNNKDLIRFDDPTYQIATDVFVAAAGGMKTGISEAVNDVWATLIGDPVKQWRMRNFFIGLERTAKFIEKKGINLSDAKPLPFGEMIAVFDGMSNEEDETISAMWSQLLSETMTSNRTDDLNVKSAASILSQMSPAVARAFKLLSIEFQISAGFTKYNVLQMQKFSEDNSGEDAALKTLKDALDSLTEEREKALDLFIGDRKPEDPYFSIVKGELFRLNLIQSKNQAHQLIRPHYEYFRNGLKVNADGLDRDFSETMQSITSAMVELSNGPSRPFLIKNGTNRIVDCELNELGKALAKTLGIAEAR